MKKQYVKPMMESEAFVANEYVAACWSVSCLECGASDDGYDQMKNSYISGATHIRDDIYTYPGTIYDETLKKAVDPCRSVTDTSVPSWVGEWGVLGRIIWGFLKTFFGAQEDTTVTSYHTIQPTQGWTATNHPTASV